MSATKDPDLTPENYEKAFPEVSSLLDMLVQTIETFVGKSTPSLAVAAGKQRAKEMSVKLDKPTPQAAVAEFVRVFREQRVNIAGDIVGGEVVLDIDHCPIRTVCLSRGVELDGQVCQIFHYYVAGILAELAGCPTRPKTIATGEKCTVNMKLGNALRR